MRAFEKALWSGDVEGATAFVADEFQYRYPFETISGKEAMWEAFSGDEGHGFAGEVRVESTDFTVDDDVIYWSSLRYFPGSPGQALTLTATFEGEVIAEVSETGALTTAEDAIGCEGSYPYSWHADYEQDASGVSSIPVEAAAAGFPQAANGLVYAESTLAIEAPMSGGRGPMVRVSEDGYTVGFVFLAKASDDTLLIDAVTACEGFLEPVFEEELEDGEPFHGAEEPAREMDPAEIVADASGAASSGGTPLPDVFGAIAGDDGAGPLPLGEVTALPESVRLDFLFEFCPATTCFRDGHFMDPSNPGVGSGRFTSETPFHIRQGFINTGDEPLGDGFDVVVYVTTLEGGEDVGQTYRYESDYVMRGTSGACGPTYRTGTGTETCEWFVHEFNEGLSAGRHALWALWEAPCSAWVDYGFTEGCTDPNEVMSLFSSGFDSPFGVFPPEFGEANEAPGTNGPSASEWVVVDVGDSLWTISEQHLGSGTPDEMVARYWLRVISLNRGLLRSGDANLIYPGEIIRLPEIGEEVAG